MAVDPTILSALTVDIATEYGVVIDPEMLDVKLDLETPVFDRIFGLRPNFLHVRPAALYGVYDTIAWTTGGTPSFPAGGDPYSVELGRSLDSVVKKSYGGSAGVKDVDNLASTMPGAPISINAESFRNDAAILLEFLYLYTRRGINRDTVIGNSTSTPTAFDGIETLITSSSSNFVLDASSTEFEPGMVDELTLQMMARGVYPTALYCNPIIHKAISDAYQGRTGVQIQMPDANNATAAGLWVSRIVTPAGVLPVVSDPFFTITETEGTYTGSVYVMVERHAGVPLLYYEWAVLPTAIPLAKVMGRGRATSTELAVWAHLCLVERTGGWAHGIIQNVAITPHGTWTNPTE